jgi:hypothetical protein
VVDTDFELEIGAGGVPGEFVVRVLRAPVGGEARAALEVDVEGWLDRRVEIEDAVMHSTVKARRRLRAFEQPLRDAGSELFDGVFTGEIASVYRASLAVADGKGRSLRVVLRLTEPELAVLPWEALYDSSRRAYVCRKDEVVRHVPATYVIAPLPIEPPLRILGLVAQPRNLAELATDDEQDRLQSALAAPINEGLIELDWVEPASWSRVHERLLHGPWHVVHFIGHGDYDHESDEGALALVDERGKANWVEASRMVDLLDMARPTPRLVVLNSCASAQDGRQELHSGTAATLVHSGIAAVAAMQFSITDDAAIVFSRGFYTALVAGKTVEEAVRSGRTEILGLGRDTLEWVTPVLYVHGDTSRLFNLTTAPSPAPPAERENGERTPKSKRTPTPPEGEPDPSTQRGGTAPRPRPVALSDDPAWPEALKAFFAGRWDDAVERLQALADRHPDEDQVAAKLADANQQRDLAAWFEDAEAAIHRNRWNTAHNALQRIVAIDPAYRDATACLDHVRHQLRRDELLEEITALHAAGHWQAVLDTAAHLAELDPDTTVAESLIVDARYQLSKTHLAERYRSATDLLERHEWQAAIHQLEIIARTRPDYRDTQGLLATARYRLKGDAARSSAAPTEPPPRGGGHRGERARSKVTVHVPRPRTIDVGQWVLCLAFNPDGTLLATGSRQRLRVWNCITGKVAWDKEIGGWSQDVNGVAFSPDGSRLATASDDQTGRVLDATSGGELLTVKHNNFVRGVAFSPDSTRFATVSTDRTSRVWDAATGKELLTVRHTKITSIKYSLAANLWVYGVTFSPDGTRFSVWSSGNNAARVWDATTGEELLDVRHNRPVTGVAFSPDGTRIATASVDKTARVWDAATGQELLTVQHTSWVHGVAFSPGSNRIAAGSMDKTARVWDATTGEELLNVQHNNNVRGVAFSPDGTRLATASDDKTVRISEIPANSA